MAQISPILIIAGSVRPTRIALQVAEWIAAIGKDSINGLFEVVDLREWPLPMDQEPGMPQAGNYATEHTRAWSRKIVGAPAIIFVTPQYNGGYPAPLKNAIDHIYAEWAGKPVMIVTYGGHGGNHCGEQLAQVCQFVKMKPIEIRPALKLSRTLIEANSGRIDAATEFSAHLDELRRAFVEFSRALAQV